MINVLLQQDQKNVFFVVLSNAQLTLNPPVVFLFPINLDENAVHEAETCVHVCMCVCVAGDTINIEIG